MSKNSSKDDSGVRDEVTKLREEIAMLEEILPLQEEFEAARKVKDKDPERWFHAKQAFEEQRTYWRMISDYLRGIPNDETEPDENGDVYIMMPSADAEFDQTSPSASTKEK